MVSINRYNYEEYFLLYVDNELSASERKQVESFVQENPDLEEELMMLKQSQLKPDTSLVLENKSGLFKSEQHNLISLENYETFFLLYVDDELSVEERRAVELFASNHPAQQQELDILMQTRITPETSVVFPDKATLYKKVGSEKVVVFKVWRIVAVAAMFLLAVGIWWLNSGTGTTKPGFAETQNEPGKKDGNGQVAQTTNEPKGATGKEQILQKENQEQGITESEKNKRKGEIEYLEPNEDRLPQLAVNSGDEHRSDASPVEETPLRPTTMIAKADVPEVEFQGSARVSDNTLIIDQPYEQAKPDENIALTRADAQPDEPGFAIGPVQTKNKLRGLFRRVTRVVEKNTHIPTGENKRLLIGNLEIALK
jgi:hypothetical protein